MRHTKDQILSAFRKVLEKQKALASKIVTKEEQAERANDREVVQIASKYTSETIVKGLADLQLAFGAAIDNLTRRLGEDSTKLEQLQRAITVETGRLEHLSEIRTAADALNVLKQEYSDENHDFDEKAKQRTEALDNEIAQVRNQWAEEQKAFEAATKKYEERLSAERTKSESDYEYELARNRKQEADAFEERKRLALRNSAEENTRRNANWAEREAALALRTAEFESHKKKVDEFPQELEEAVKKAREEAMRVAHAEAKIKAELLEKEVEANRKVYALQIQALEAALAKQAEQIEAVSAQLQTATKQTQDLAHKAVEGASRRIPG